jgi:hypothetical protein
VQSVAGFVPVLAISGSPFLCHGFGYFLRKMMLIVPSSSPSNIIFSIITISAKIMILEKKQKGTLM